MMRMLPGVSNGTWVDVGGGLADGLAAGGDALRMFTQVHAVHVGTAPPAAPAVDDAAATKPVHVRTHTVASLDGDAAATIGVARGSADVVTISHGLVAEADWESRLALATSLLKPGGLLAVADLATPTAAPPEAYMWRHALGAIRAAFWGAARPRGAAPHHGAVMAQLRAATAEVHFDETPASWPLGRSPLRASHFVYVGRTPA